MQSSQVRILEKFGVSSVVMPYFGYAHQSFLLLSRLSKGSRTMLDDFYREIVNSLFEWNILISINDQNTKAMFLPSDLFKYSINLKNESILQEFIDFIRMKHQHKGHYFNAHYMHERLRISNLYIRPDLIKELFPDLDILTSIKLTDENNWTSTEPDWNSCSIIDKFMITDFDDFIVDETHLILPQYFIEASKLFESETCWKPFYKLFFLNLTYNSYSQTISIFEDIENIGMKIYLVNIRASNKEELEDLTNPKYFNKGLSNLRITLDDTIMLTNAFFDNINWIGLKTISFEFAYGVTGSFDIIRILKNAPQSIKLNLIHEFAFYSCSLCFKNVPIKIIQLDCEDPLFVKWNAFTCYVEIDQLDKNFWLTSINSETTKDTSDTFFHLKYSKEYNFDCCKLIDESEIMKSYKIKFPNHHSVSKCECIIPMKYLYSVYYRSKSILSLISHKDRLEFMNEISKAQKIVYKINYCSELQYLNEWVSLFPHKCRYSIYEYSKPDNCDEFETLIKSKLDTNCFDDFSNLKLFSIYVSFEISANSYEFIRKLLSLPNVKAYLTGIWLVLPKLSQALSILSQLSDCLLIESVELGYWEKDSEVDPTDLIKSSMNSFTKKVGIIDELNVSLKTSKS